MGHFVPEIPFANGVFFCNEVGGKLQDLSVKLLALFQEGGKLPLYTKGKPKASFGDQPAGLVKTGWREARACL
jgi:hypothetical protein